MQNYLKIDSDLILPTCGQALTKQPEVSAAVPQSECDLLRVASVLNLLGLPHVGFHHTLTLDRGWVLI